MRFYKANNEINGFEYKTMFASVNFSNDGRTPLNIYENETEKINEDDELCIIEKIYMDGQWKRTSILERNIDPSDFTIE